MGCLWSKQSSRRVTTNDPRDSTSSRSTQALTNGDNSATLNTSGSGSGSTGSSSKSKKNRTEIQNQTDEKIVVREKYREVWGRKLYTIEPRGTVSVSPNLMAGTFVWMEVLWGPREQPAVPPMCIESEDLPAFQTFIITGRGAKLSLEKIPAERKRRGRICDQARVLR